MRLFQVVCLHDLPRVGPIDNLRCCTFQRLFRNAIRLHLHTFISSSYSIERFQREVSVPRAIYGDRKRKVVGCFRRYYGMMGFSQVCTLLHACIEKYYFPGRSAGIASVRVLFTDAVVVVAIGVLPMDFVKICTRTRATAMGTS